MNMHRITDLSIALPQAAWTDQDATLLQLTAPRPEGGWRLLDYWAGEIRGRALQTSCIDSAELSVPLPGKGWHAVSLGMLGHYDQDVIEVRLRGESNWQTLRAGSGPVQEVPWRFIDLQPDSALQLRYPRDLLQLPGRLRSQAVSARLLWVRVQAMSDSHVQQLQTGERKPLVYLNDGHSLFWWDSQTAEPGIVQRSLGRFGQTEWRICCFGAGGADLVNYPSQLGTLIGEGAWDDPWPANLKTARLIAELVEQGEDVLQLAVDTAHAQDQDFWFYLRPQAWVGEPPFDHAFRSRFFCEHPQWRCRKADGQALGKLSYAYAEVRAQVNGIFVEALSRGADAIGVALVRAMPLVWYEPPIQEYFAEQYGADVRAAESDDPRLQAVWQHFTELWFRELRDLLDQAGPDRTGHRRKLVVIAGPSPQWHQRFGMDIPALVSAGLIDVLMPYPETSENLDLTSWRDWLGDDSPVQLLPGLGNFSDHGMSVAQLQARALNYYRTGAHGLNRWDTPGSLVGLQLEQPQALALWQEHYLGEQAIDLKEFAGLWLEDFPPLDGF